MEYRGTRLEIQEVPYRDFPSFDQSAIREKFLRVIEQEGPVVDDFLELKVLKSYGIAKRGSDIAPFLRSVLLSTGAVYTKQTDCDRKEHLVFWPESYRGREEEIMACKSGIYEEFRPSGQKQDMDEGCFRSIADFPQLEILNAMKAQLEDCDGFPKEELFTHTNHSLGFQVKGRQIRQTLETVFKAGIANGIFSYNRRTGKIRLRQASKAPKAAKA